MIWHWLLQVTGTANEQGHWYAFWSGFGSDIGEVAIIGGLLSVYRKHNCHDKGCWRIGRHVVDGTPRCNRHHLAAREAAAAAAPAAVQDDISAKLGKLSEDISGLAEAIRATLQPQSQPASAERLVPPAAAAKVRAAVAKAKQPPGGGM